MAKKSKMKIMAILLLLSIILLWVPIPFIDGKIIGSLLVLGVSIYLLIK